MSVTVIVGPFEWDGKKSESNVAQHGLDFYMATETFSDSFRVVAIDELHSSKEPRFFCIGRIGKRIATVRFTPRGNRIRIIGAGYWRKGKQLYEKENLKKP